MTVTVPIGSRLPFVVRHARLTGALLLIIPIPFAIIDMLSSRLVVPGDAATTADQILASEPLFRLGIVATLLLMLADATLAVLVFYPLLRPVNPGLAMLMVVLNLIAVPMTMLNEVTWLGVLQLQGTVDPSIRADQVGLLLNLYDKGSLIAGLLWGVWLIPYATLVYRSRFLPRFFSILLVIECLGWVIHSLSGLLLANPDPNLAQLPEITSLVELILPLWLLIRGINVQRWQAHLKLVDIDETSLARASVPSVHV
jgi:Domain of unknown function (DUF4386)